MTIEIVVDGEVYSGSSVVEVSKRENDPLSRVIGPYFVTEVRGEAAFLELPGKQYLFSLLRDGPSNSGPSTNATNIFSKKLPPIDSLNLYEVLSKSRFKANIPRSHFPILVTFADTRDPMTVKKMHTNYLAGTFGPGVSLKRITLELSDEPVTEGNVEQVLEWLRTGEDKRIDSGSIASIDLDLSSEMVVTGEDFIR